MSQGWHFEIRKVSQILLVITFLAQMSALAMVGSLNTTAAGYCSEVTELQGSVQTAPRGPRPPSSASRADSALWRAWARPARCSRGSKRIGFLCSPPTWATNTSSSEITLKSQGANCMALGPFIHMPIMSRGQMHTCCMKKL